MSNLELVGLTVAAVVLLLSILAPIIFIVAALRSCESREFYQGLTGLGKVCVIVSISLLMVGYLWSAVSAALHVLTIIQ